MMQEPLPDNDTDGVGSHPPASVRSLKQAMRRARVDNAERAGVLADLRGAQLARLEMLHEALKPLLTQLPADADLFDIGLMPGVTPRLFIDMVGFVEMGREARIYHFYQDGRHGRVLLAQTSDVATMVNAVTDYVARRLLERDKALAQDLVTTSSNQPVPATRVAPSITRQRRPFRWLAIAFAFLIDLLGSITFFMIIAAIAWMVWNKIHAQM